VSAASHGPIAPRHTVPEGIAPAAMHVGAAGDGPHAK
jgi:hypothetical protein